MLNTDEGPAGGMPEGIAPRAAHWSATHLVGSNELTDIDQFTGESQRAEQALDDAGLRPNSEVVMLQSEKLLVARFMRLRKRVA